MGSYASMWRFKVSSVNPTTGIVVTEVRYWLFLQMSAAYALFPMVLANLVGINFSVGLLVALFVIVRTSISLSRVACSMLLLIPIVLVTTRLLVGPQLHKVLGGPFGIWCSRRLVGALPKARRSCKMLLMAFCNWCLCNCSGKSFQICSCLGAHRRKSEQQFWLHYGTRADLVHQAALGMVAICV